MATYEMMKTLITEEKKSGAIDKKAWEKKLDVFLLFDRITAEQYRELVELMGEEPVAKDHSGTKQ